jgi:hypothetical protein
MKEFVQNELRQLLQNKESVQLRKKITEYGFDGCNIFYFLVFD